MGVFLLLEASQPHGYDIPFRFWMEFPSDAGLGNRRAVAVDLKGKGTSATGCLFLCDDFLLPRGLAQDRAWRRRLLKGARSTKPQPLPLRAS
jgi:hypothetical protein